MRSRGGADHSLEISLELDDRSSSTLVNSFLQATQARNPDRTSLTLHGWSHVRLTDEATRTLRRDRKSLERAARKKREARAEHRARTLKRRAKLIAVRAYDWTWILYPVLALLAPTPL